MVYDRTRKWLVTVLWRFLFGKSLFKQSQNNWFGLYKELYIASQHDSWMFFPQYGTGVLIPTWIWKRGTKFQPKKFYSNERLDCIAQLEKNTILLWLDHPMCLYFAHPWKCFTALGGGKLGGTSKAKWGDVGYSYNMMDRDSCTRSY